MSGEVFRPSQVGLCGKFIGLTIRCLMVDRDYKLNVRMAREDGDMLRKLAERDGISQSDWIRLTVRRAYIAAFGEKPPKTKERPK